MIEVIEYYNQVISEWARAYYANGFFLLLAIVAFIYLYVSCKELRYKFLLPIFIMLFITVNPILYTYVFRRIIYWRLFWMLPTAILIATAVIVFLKQIKAVWMKLGLLLVVTASIISQGQYMFSYGVFFQRSNWEKVSQETIDVCDIILKLDEKPKVVVNGAINTEMRQYAPQIILLYGRDTTGYIRNPGETARAVYESYLSSPIDYENIFEQARNHGYNFVVTNIGEPVDEEILEKYEYQEVGRTSQYIIYN